MTVLRTKRDQNGKKTKVVRRHKACSSEFDYQGWSAWGEWRWDEERTRDIVRDLLSRELELDDCAAGVSSFGAKWVIERRLRKQAQAAGAPGKKDCWNTCNYPSECRWGAQMQQQNSSASTSSSSTTPAASTSTGGTSNTPDDCLSEGSAMEVDETVPATTFNGILENIDGSSSQADPEQATSKESRSAMDAILNALRMTVSRRKHVGNPSPLAPGPSTVDDISGTRHGTINNLELAKLVQQPEADIVMGGAESTTGSAYIGTDELVESLRSPDPLLLMPSLSPVQDLVEVFDRDAKVFRGTKADKNVKRLRRKGYVGHVDSLRNAGLI